MGLQTIIQLSSFIAFVIFSLYQQNRLTRSHHNEMMAAHKNEIEEKMKIKHQIEENEKKIKGVETDVKELKALFKQRDDSYEKRIRRLEDTIRDFINKTNNSINSLFEKIK
jgi:seryl-tRNA synthetase